MRSNPYVGLRPFAEEDSDFFFGRREQTAALLEKLRTERFLAVVGSSGSGKSSLVRAGLLPLLHGGFLLAGKDEWLIAIIRPGDAPLYNLAVSLCDPDGTATETQRPDLVESLMRKIRERHTEGVIDHLRHMFDGGRNVLLVVDQFEEIFAFRGLDERGEVAQGGRSHDERARRRAEADDFVNLLLELTERRDAPVYVAITMRTDFLGDCDLFYGLPEAMNRGRYLVPRLSRQQIREAIEGPALLMRVEYSPRLRDRLLNELGDRFDRLPILQHALLRTWDRWVDQGAVGPVDIDDYEAAGTLDNALSRDAESVLPILERDGVSLWVVSRIFKRLTDTDVANRRVRRPARVSDLAAAAGVDRDVVLKVVSKFQEDGRHFLFLASDGDVEDPRVDISHESLIRRWGRLRTWVDEERISRNQFRELVDRATRHRDGMADVLWDVELNLFSQWQEKEKPTEAWAAAYARHPGEFALAMKYLDESRRQADARVEREARRQRQRTWALRASGAVAVIFAGLGLFARSQWSAAAEARDIAGGALLQAQEQRDSAAASEQRALNAEANRIRQVFRIAWRGLETLEPVVYNECSTYGVVSGVRGLYCDLRGIMSLQDMTALAPMPVFTSGPHVDGTLNFESDDFGHYNPEFVAWLHENLVPAITGDGVFQQATRRLYERHLSVNARVFYVTYHELRSVPDVVQEEIAYYRQTPAGTYSSLSAESRAGLEEYQIQFESEYPYLDVFDSANWIRAHTAYAYWMRRWIDGTAESVYAILAAIMEAYDRAFVESVTANEPKLIRRLLGRPR